MIRLSCISLAAAMLLGACGTAAAQEDDMPRAPSELLPFGEEACFGAVIEESARKPGQTLVEIHAYHLFESHPEFERIEPPREQAMALERKRSANWNDNWLEVIARFSDSPHLFSQYVSCRIWADDRASGAISCNFDCDGGGGFIAHETVHGFRMSFRTETSHLTFNSDCETPGIFDGPYRSMSVKEAGGRVDLRRLPATACSDADKKLQQRILPERTSLRERINGEGWRCLARSYDDRHLKQHPGQMVTAAAVAFLGPVSREEFDEYDTTVVDARASLRLRDGRVVTKDVRCTASDYDFLCDGDFTLARNDAETAWFGPVSYGEPEPQPEMLGVVLGAEDRRFRLQNSPEAACDLR